MSSALTKASQIVFQLSSVLIPLAIIYVSPPGINLFSWHPVLMSLAVPLLMAQATVIFNSGYNVFTTGNKSAKITWHWQLQAAAIACLLGGFAAIYLTKNLNSKPHFTTWHGTMGLATIMGALGASCGGIATKYGVQFPPLVRPALIKWVHSMAGTAVFSLGYITLVLGFCSTWALDNMTRLERWGLGFMALFLWITVVYLAKRNYLFKIFQSGKK